MVQRNMLFPFSGSKNEPSKQAATFCYLHPFIKLLLACLIYSQTLKMETACELLTDHITYMTIFLHTGYSLRLLIVILQLLH